MKIDEAIVTIKAKFTDPGAVPTSDFRRACRLGIEALKRCKTLAENSPLWRAKPLPGEDPE